MKKIVIVLSAAAVLGIVGVCAVVLFEVMTVTDPYVVPPTSVTAAPDGAQRGHIVNPETHALSVFSKTPVVVVADPGVSFHHEVLWIVTDPQVSAEDILMEYSFAMPDYAKAEHVNPIDAAVPAKIIEAATGNSWD